MFAGARGAVHLILCCTLATMTAHGQAGSATSASHGAQVDQLEFYLKRRLDERIAAAVISGHFNHTVRMMVESSPHYTPYIATPEDYAFFSGLIVDFSDSDVVSLIAPARVRRNRNPGQWRMDGRPTSATHILYPPTRKLRRLAR